MNRSKASCYAYRKNKATSDFLILREDIWFDTMEQHEAIAGAFPLELSRVNIYHAQTTSQMRVRVLIDLEN